MASFALGYARAQIYDLYNFMERLITPSSETVGQWLVKAGTSADVPLTIAPYEYESNSRSRAGKYC